MDEQTVEDLMAAAEKGAPVLTANARLARHLKREYDRRMSARGLGAWRTPLILPLSSWAELLWEASAPGEPLLDATRSRALWERVVKGDRLFSGAGTLASSGVADASWAAYSLMKEYRIPWPADDIYLTEEAMALKRFARSYGEAVERLGFVESAGLMDSLIRFIERGGGELPPEAVAAGFDELTPRTELFFHALKKRGVEVRAVGGGPAGRRADVRVRAYEDTAAEVVQAARWAREALGRGSSVAFVVPELEKYRSLIKREFAAELDPASVLPGHDAPEAFNISLGLPLAEEPLVASALGILAIGEGPAEIDGLLCALRSPYMSGVEASMEAARVDALLRKDGLKHASLADIVKRLGASGASPLRARCEAWLAWLRKSRDRRFSGKWAEDFSALLNRLGWTRGITLSSTEFQALRAWKSALGRFSTLDEVAGPVGRPEAFALLRKLCLDTIHQCETPECRIQVLGLLETAGLSFDHIWLMGCHEDALPPGPSPNPFIPVYIQKSHGVPRSSSERELAFARKIVERLLSCAPRVEVSYPLRAEGKERLLSPLFRHVGDEGEEALVTITRSSRLKDFQLPTASTAPHNSLVTITRSSRLKDLSRSCVRLEQMGPDAPVPVGAAELGAIRGGTSIIKDQSHCPFKAFAAHRLGAVPLDEPAPGLSAAGRGSLIHLALKYFWEELGSQARLRGLKESGGIEAFAGDIADRAIKEVDLPRPFSVRFLEIERERLIAVLLDWAGKELEREPFVVRRVEEREEMDISGLKLRGRIDRVDELDGGARVIIDYKSGKIESKDWLGQRPRDPQLLIYSTSGRYDAVSFARLSPGECRFVGLSRSGTTLPGIPAYEQDPMKEKFDGAGDWDKLMELWRGIVSGLASDFLAGQASVDPLGGADRRYGVCRYCALRPLCRVGGGDERATGEDGQDD